MTAEFAVVLPAVVALLALCLGGVEALGRQVVVVDAASRAARLLARGEDPSPVVASLQDALGAVQHVESVEGGLACVELAAPAVGSAALLGVEARSRSCAFDGGV